MGEIWLANLALYLVTGVLAVLLVKDQGELDRRKTAVLVLGWPMCALLMGLIGKGKD